MQEISLELFDAKNLVTQKFLKLYIFQVNQS